MSLSSPGASSAGSREVTRPPVSGSTWRTRSPGSPSAPLPLRVAAWIVVGVDPVARGLEGDQLVGDEGFVGAHLGESARGLASPEALALGLVGVVRQEVRLGGGDEDVLEVLRDVECDCARHGGHRDAPVVAYQCRVRFARRRNQANLAAVALEVEVVRQGRASAGLVDRQTIVAAALDVEQGAGVAGEADVVDALEVGRERVEGAREGYTHAALRRARRSL